MSAIAIATVSTVGGIAGSYMAGQSAEDAARMQAGSAEQGIAEQRRQFDAVQTLMKPYVQSGESAVGAQGDLAGLNGPDAQRAAIWRPVPVRSVAVG